MANLGIKRMQRIELESSILWLGRDSNPHPVGVFGGGDSVFQLAGATQHLATASGLHWS